MLPLRSAGDWRGHASGPRLIKVYIHVSMLTMCEALRAIVGSYVWLFSLLTRKDQFCPPLRAAMKKREHGPTVNLSRFPLILNVCFCCVLHKSLSAPSGEKKKKKSRSGKILHVLQKEVASACVQLLMKSSLTDARNNMISTFSSTEMKLSPSFSPSPIAVHCSSRVLPVDGGPSSGFLSSRALA